MDHLPLAVLQHRMDEAKQAVTIGGKYVHYKDPDHPYQVIDLVMIEATEEVGVLYRPVDGRPFTWLRPIEDFTAMVEWNGEQIPRFRQAV